MKYLTGLLILGVVLCGAVFADDLLLENTTISSGKHKNYYATGTITAQNFIVESGGTCNLVSGVGGNLKPGFHAKTGSEGRSTVANCWTGGAGDNNWNTKENWSRDRVPLARDFVYFGSYSALNCNLAGDVTVAGIVMWPGYTGTLDFSSRNVTINGDLIKQGGTLNAGTSKIILAGTQSQEVKFNSSQTLYNIEITNNTGIVVFSDGVTANELKFNSGNYVLFGAGKIFSITTLTGGGSQSNPAYLTSTNATDVWYLNAANGNLSYVVVSRCNASGGASITASNSSDDGGNTNWAFGGEEGSPVLSFSPAQEVFIASSISVSITSSPLEDVNIYYTEDGTIPVKGEGTTSEYTSAITVSADKTILAYGVYDEGGAGEKIGAVYGRSYDKLAASEYYVRKNYGTNAMTSLGDVRKFGGQVWWTGLDGLCDEMAGDDQRLKEFDDDIEWTVTGGTPSSYTGSYLIFTDDGRLTPATMTLTIGENSFEGCTGNDSVGSPVAPQEPETPPEKDPCKYKDGAGVGSGKDKGDSPQTVPTIGIPVGLNIRHYPGWYDLEDYTLGRCSRFSMLHELKEVDSDEVIIRFVGNGPIAACCHYKKVGDVYTIDPAKMREYGEKHFTGEITKTGETFKFVNDNDIEFYFDSSTPHKLTKIKDPEGNEITMTYSAQDVDITDASGNVYHFDCDIVKDGKKLISQVTVKPYDTSEPDWRTWSYDYDNDGFLTKETYTTPEPDLSYEFGYDEWGNLTKKVDYSGKTETYEYDEKWRITKKTDAEGEVTTYQYAGPESYDYNMTSTSPAGGETVVNYYHEDVVRVNNMTLESGVREEYEYDGYRFITKKTIKPAASSADDIAVVYYYDSSHNLTKEIFDSGGLNLTTEMWYDTERRLTKEKDRNNVYSEFYYDTSNNLTKKVIDPSPGLTITETWEYDGNGLLTKYKDPEQNNDVTRGATTYEYDSLGYLTRVTDGDNKYETYAYDKWGNKLSFTDKNNNTTTYEYDAHNRLTKETDSANYTLLYEYDGNGNLTRFTDKNNNATLAYYDDVNRVIKVIGAGGGGGGGCAGCGAPGGGLPAEGDYWYDGDGNITLYKDVLERATAYYYDSAGNVTRTIKDYGYMNIDTYNYYDTLNRLTKTINENGYYTEYYYDKASRQTKASRQLGQEPDETTIDTVSLYDNMGNLTKTSQDPMGLNIETAYYYDKNSRRTKAVDDYGTGKLNIETTYSYDDNSNLIETIQDAATGGLNIETEYHYDYKVNRLTRTVVDPTPGLDIETIYAYDPVGNRTLVTDDNTKSTQYFYDARNMLTKVTDANTENRYEYDGNGNRIKVTAKVTATKDVATKYWYCSRNYLTKQVVDWADPPGTHLNLTTTYDVCQMGKITKMTNPEGKVTKYQYDRLYRRTKAVDDYDDPPTKLNIKTEYYYDDTGNLTRIVDNNNNATSYEYDELNRLTRETFADNESKVYVYNNVGNLTQLTDQVGNIFAMAYDNMNRLLTKSITRAAGVNGTSAQTFVYDNIGRMTKAQDNNGDNADSTIAQLYDKVSRLTKETQTVGAKTARDVISYYDGVGNRTKLTHPSSRNITFSYDSVNNLTKIAEGATIYATYTYDNTNMVLTKTLGTSTAVALNVAYDNAYRSTSYDWKKSGNTVVGFTYGYSNAGNKKYEEKLHDTDKSQLYIYDGVYRLTKFKEGTLNEAKTDITSPTYYQDWDLDGLGNWTKFYDNSGTPETRTHNNVNELTARDATNLTYDDNGNLTDDGTSTYAYDALNRLIKVTRKSDSAVMGEYAYDAFNRRIWRKADEDQSGSQETELYYVYDGNRVVEERVYSDEDLKRDYIYGNYIDEPIFGRSDNNDNGDFADSEEQFYYTHNNIYNVAALLNTSGAIIEAYEYKPYGKVTIYTGPGADTTWFTSDDDTTGARAGNYYLFTGRRYDSEAEQYYYRLRYHSPELGRFLQRDPVFDVNLYWYVRNNPAVFLDSLGLFLGPPWLDPLTVSPPTEVWEWVLLSTSDPEEKYFQPPQGFVKEWTGPCEKEGDIGNRKYEYRYLGERRGSAMIDVKMGPAIPSGPLLMTKTYTENRYYQYIEKPYICIKRTPKKCEEPVYSWMPMSPRTIEYIYKQIKKIEKWMRQNILAPTEVT